MKILYIITKPGAGGAQTHVWQLSSRMEEEGNEVAIMSQPGKWPASKFYPNPHLRNSFNPLHGLKAMRDVRKAVREFDPDVVSLHSSAAGFWGRLALRQAQGKPAIIFTAHSWGFTPGVPALRRWVALIAEKLVGRYADKIICVSEFDRQLALKYKIAPKEKLITIHNGVEPSSTNPKSETLNTKQFQNSNDQKNKIRIVFVGRLGGQKYPELLLEAYRQVTSNREQVTSNLQLQIIGDGPKLASLKKYVSENNMREGVEFLGGLQREKVLEELAKADIFVLTSHYEGFPRSVLEAMARGLPVIASGVGGTREALRPLNYAEHNTELGGKENGILLKKNSTEELKAALEILIENQSLREKMGANSRRRAEQEFSLEKMIDKTTGVYRKLAVRK